MAIPLAIVLVGIVILHPLRQDVRPVFIGIIKGLSVTAQSNALYFTMLIICGLNAGFPVMANLAAKFHWPMIEAGATFAAAVCSAVLPFMIKPPPTSFTSPEIKTVTLV